MSTTCGHKLVLQRLHCSSHIHYGQLKPFNRLNLPQGQGHALYEKGHVKNFLEADFCAPYSASELLKGPGPLVHMVMESQSS